MNVQFTIKGLDSINKSLQKAQQLKAEDVADSMAAGIDGLFVAHFINLNATRSNKLGGQRTNYWQGAAKETRVTVSGSTVLVTVGQIGVRRHYLGGPPIKPSGKTSEITGKPIRMLTIPIHPMAHGKTLGMWQTLGVNFYRSGGVLKRQTSGERADSDPAYYALAKQTKAAKPDPSVIPSVETIAKAADDALEELKQSMLDG